MTTSIKPADSAMLNTPISLPLRLWLGVEVLFGLAAIGAVFLHPEQTATNFAWPIKPAVMAATFGAFYLSVGCLFGLGLVARRWQQVRVICIPAAVFTALMLMTTFLHWSKFTVGTPPFYVWFASYLLPPPIFVALYIWQQKRAAPVGTGRSQPLARSVRAFLQLHGWVLVCLALLAYGFPALLIAIAPWRFTPLTVRVFCGWLVGVGILQAGMAREGDWPRVKIGSTMLVVLPFALLLQLWRFHRDVVWNNLWLWLLLLDFGLMSLLWLGLWFQFAARKSQNRTT